MFFELLIEAIDGAFSAKFCGYPTISAGARFSIPVITIGTYKNHNPEGTCYAIYEIGAGSQPCQYQIIKGCNKNYRA